MQSRRVLRSQYRNESSLYSPCHRKSREENQAFFAVAHVLMSYGFNLCVIRLWRFPKSRLTQQASSAAGWEQCRCGSALNHQVCASNHAACGRATGLLARGCYHAEPNTRQFQFQSKLGEYSEISSDA